jgi:hypothetical protein
MVRVTNHSTRGCQNVVTRTTPAVISGCQIGYTTPYWGSSTGVWLSSVWCSGPYALLGLSLHSRVSE